jgi:hypothetical protein
METTTSAEECGVSPQGRLGVSVERETMLSGE